MRRKRSSAPRGSPAGRPGGAAEAGSGAGETRLPERGRSGRRLLLAWGPVVAFECAVLFASSRPGLNAPGGLDHLDKGAHFLEYATLGALLYRGLRLSGASPSRAIAIAFGAAALLGAGDERLQAEIPGRDSSVLDWAADVAGGLAGAVGWAWLERRRRRGPRDAPASRVRAAGTEG